MASNNKLPLISIGIPTYNRPEGLARALKCISEQTYKNIEIIVSDNCSPGCETEQVVMEFQKNDSRIIYIKQSFNIGPAANFDYLKNNAKGKYFAWAADDDFCSLNFIEELAKVLDADPELVLVTSDVITVDSYGKEICISELDSIRVGATWENARKRFFEYPISNVFFAIYGLYRLDALRKISTEHALSSDGLATNSEVPFLANLSLLGKIASIPQKLKFYCSHSDSVFYDEQRKIKPMQRVRLALDIRVKLLKAALKADISSLSKIELLLVIFNSAVNMRTIYVFARSKLSRVYRYFK